MDRPQSDPLRIQAVYYIATGLWPMIHLRSFYAITGAKSEGWLVQTFGLLVAAVGAVLWRRRVGEGRRVQEHVALSTGLALAVADVVFVARRRISPIYVLDAAAQVALAASLKRRLTNPT